MSTICAPATASGGAMAVIRVSGPEAIAVTSRIFSKDLTDAKGYTLHYGWIKDGDAQLIDDVLVSVFRAPHSYTGEDSTEISCHGSQYIVQKAMEALIKSGVRMAAPGEFTKRAFLAGKMDLSQAEAVADLIASGNEATHRMALSQMRGGFSRELEGLREQLLRLTSLLELELDFSDHEDLEFADRTELTTLANVIYRHVHHLTDSFRTGNALKQGIPVAIIGAPNVGKSTLLNALVHEDRAIVSDIQGTTRDLIEDTIRIDGVTFRFIDTAGLRETSDRIEQLGIERSIRAAQKADIIILLTEPGKPFPEISTPPHSIILHVVNKADLLSPYNGSSAPTSAVPDTLHDAAGHHMTAEHHTAAGLHAAAGHHATTVAPGPLHISSRTGYGLPELNSQLLSSAQRLLSPIGSDTTIVTNLRHYEALLHAQEALLRTTQALSANLPGDLIAEDLRQCLHYLAEITGGEITTPEVLSNIFKNFCIGK